MSARRGDSGLSGVLLIDKPAGMTSHDVVNRVRRASAERRVGHAGTLDPDATGLLVVLVGPATRLAPFLTAADKTYEATIAFGTATDTDDAAGEVTATATVPAALFAPEGAAQVLAGFLGQGEQVPPAYSAIKRDGVVAHRAARAGAALALEPRAIHVAEAALLARDAGAGTWDVRFVVSKGTYIRSLARDIGRAAGTVAHLGALRRTASGTFDLAHAAPLDAIETGTDGANTLRGFFADPVPALGMPVVEAAGHETALAGGRPLAVELVDAREGQAVALATASSLLALYRVRGSALIADTVFPGGVSRGTRR